MPPAPTVAAMMGFLVATMGEPAARTWWEWFSVQHPDWARQGWSRLDDARAACPG